MKFKLSIQKQRSFTLLSRAILELESEKTEDPKDLEIIDAARQGKG